MSVRARKRFGQHFLTSDDAIDRIVSAVDPQPGETIVEIGPGHAAITTPLSRHDITLHAIELDRNLCRQLKATFRDSKNVIIHESDALHFDFSTLGTDLRLVGNLPYNISTPLLFHLLEFENVTRDMHFMLQKEVVDRMSADPGSKSYGRLTIMLGVRMEVVPLFEVPPSAFTPPPKVVSSVVRMRHLREDALGIRDPETLAAVVKLAFSQRRKTLRNAVKALASEADIATAGLDAGARPEQIPVAGWVALANHIAFSK